MTTVTNAEEHEYLDSYLSNSIIGSRALSSVLVEGKKDGSGINVTTSNITYCTPGMYENALATAGIENADIKVAGPFNISGTAALVGAIKAYENMTGEQVSEENADTATNELVVTGQVAENVGDQERPKSLSGRQRSGCRRQRNYFPGDWRCGGSGGPGNGSKSFRGRPSGDH